MFKPLRKKRKGDGGDVLFDVEGGGVPASFLVQIIQFLAARLISDVIF